jgi:hypothetical protein
MSKKLLKRVKKTGEEHEAAVVNALTKNAKESHDDEVLFSLDRSGSKAVKRKVATELLPKQEGTFMSETEKKLVKRAALGRKQQYGKYVTPIGSNAARDLWDEPVEETTAATTTIQNKRLKVPLPGQSYNPSSTDHQNSVAEAVALQLKRDETLARSSARVVARKLADAGMDYEEIGAIPLSDELRGSLREVLPKGVALSQRVASMRQSGEVLATDRRTRRAHEKPHGARRLVYHAKHKYT